MVYGMTYKIFMSLIFGVLIVAASLPIVFLIICFNKSFLLSILLAFFYSIFNWGILGTVGTSISAAKIARSCQHQNNNGSVCSCDCRIAGLCHQAISAKWCSLMKSNKAKCGNGVKMV